MTMKRVILRFASVRWVLMLCISLTIIVYFCLIGKLHIISRHNNLISNNILTFSKKVKSKERFHTDYKSQQYSDYMKYLTLVPGSSLASTWIVNARDGVSVFNSKSGHLEIIDILPFGSIVFEEIVHEDAIFISFPIHGWIYATRWTDGDRYMSSNQTSLISNIPSTTTSLTKLTVVQPIHTIKSRAMTRSHGLQICASVKYLEDTDVLNGDLGVNPATVTSAQDCCFLCALEKPCSAFTYTHNGECWLKHISPTTQIQPKPRQVSSTDPSISKPSPPELISGLLTTKVTTTSVAKSTAAIPEINNKKLSTTCCSFSEAGSLSLRGHWSDTHVVSSSPFVLQLEKSSIDWTEQWPIGNGRTGALIGGLLDVEVIPFSIAGLYSHRQPPRSNLDSEIEKVTQNVPLINPLNPAVPIVATPTRAELFHTARQQLSNGQIEEAQESAAGLENGDFPLGRFEYVADLVLLFSSSPILPRIIDPSVQEKPGVVPPVQPQDEPGIGGRAALIQRMKEQLKSVDSDSALTTLGSPLKSNSILDMRRGIVHTTFLENVADAGSDEASDSANEEGDGRDKENIVNSDNESKNEMSSVSTNSIIVRAHSREWFSSTVEDVTVGRMRCSTNVHFPPRNSTALSGCLNLFLATNRDPSYTDGKPLVTTHVEEASNSPIGRLIQDSAKSAGSTRIFALDLSLQSSPGIFVPTTCMCGLIVCHIPNVGFTDTSGLHTLPDGTAGVICNGADTVDVITSVQIGKEPSDGGPDESSIASLKSDCWQHVFSAAESGFSALRKQHIDWFSERMAQTDVQFESSNSSQACPDTPLRDRLGSLGDGCQEAGKTTLVNHSLDISLLAQSFQFSRYLLFSSATRSVNNLQGIWADGVKSAWAGDYHLNINLQQAYWPADLVGAGATVQPLLEFVEKLASSGKFAARELYNVTRGDSWVAHGFTDNRMYAGMMGNLQWSMCVSCGAWLAVQLWDHSLFDLQPEVLQTRVLPILRGAVEFFSDYVWVDEAGNAHTGPTTSPENSYELRSPEPTPPDVAAVQQQVEAQIKQLFLQKQVIAKRQQPQPQMDSKTGIFSILTNAHIPRQLIQQQQQQQQVEPTITPQEHQQIEQQVRRQMQRQQQMVHQQSRKFPYLAFTPAIDVAVLRQLSNSFLTSIAWLREKRIADDETGLLKDLELGKRFADLVSKLPNKGLPLVDDATCAISEYPENQASKPVKNMTGTSAGFDPGHRHFSPMLWLYPGVMTQPGQSRGAEQARDAGEEFMRIKTSGNGGHTSWSTVWSACIWARLQQAEPALDSLLRMLKKFSARNLLSLHPDLSPAADLPTCGTCFKEGAESQRRSSASTVGSGPNRGLTTAVNDKFQLDGNMGYAAAMVEMLVQSHLPGYLLLLPALPNSLSKGHARGLHCRGDVKVDLIWTSSEIDSATLSFRSPHPWNKGLPESTSGSGFVDADFAGSFSPSKHNYQVTVLSPNRLSLAPSLCAKIESMSDSSEHNYLPPVWQTRRWSSIIIRVSTFPCVATLQHV